MSESQIQDAYAGLAAGETPPWEIGGPQPAISAVLADLDIGPRVLDLGCGTGDLCLHLAQGGHRVVGVDLSAVAVNLARAKAAERELTATFWTGDARHPSDVAGDIGRGYDLVLDSGLLETLDADERATYAAELPQVCADDGVLVVLATGVGADELERLFAGWASVRVSAAEVASVGGPLSGQLLLARRGR